MIRARTTITWLFLCGIVCASDDGLFMEPPTITSTEYSLTLDPGTNLSIECASEHPITWKQFKGFTGTCQISYAEVPAIDICYRSTIHLINITYKDVGHYFCVTNETQERHDYSAAFIFERMVQNRSWSGISEIYVFVNDSHNQLVHREFPEITVVDDKFLILTCKPTLNDTSLTLYEGSNEKEYQRYDNRLGFILQFSEAVENYGKFYTCRPDENIYPKSNSIVFNIKYHVPKVQSYTGVFANEGGQLKLNCSIDILKDEPFDIKWIFPNHTNISSELDQVQISTEKRPNSLHSDLWIAISTMTFNNIRENDTGYYGCEVTDHLKDRSRDGLFIEVVDFSKVKSGPYCGIHSLDKKYDVDVSSWRDEVIFQVRYVGKAKRLWWRDKFRKDITSNNDKYEIATTDDHISLKIKNLSSEDAGNYIVAAEALPRCYSHITFKLRLKAPPVVTVKPVKFGVNTDDYTATFFCSAQGYPTPKIMWKFTPCSTMPDYPYWPLCDETIRTRIEDEHELIAEQISAVSVKTIEFGRVECHGVNTEGIYKAVDYIKSVYNETEVVIRMLTPDTTIFRGDNVSLTCEADYSKYEKLSWDRNNGAIDESITRDVRLRNSGIRQSMISWPSIRIIDSGTYKCVASYSWTSGGDNNLEKFSSKKIDVREPEAPVLHGDVEENFNYTLGTSFRLLCNITGLPVPTIMWYLDGQFIQNETEGGQTLYIADSKVQDNGTYKCVGTNRFGNATKLIHVEVTDTTPNIESVDPLTAEVTDVSPLYYFMLVVAMLVSILSTIYLYSRFNRFRRYRNFERGNPDLYNPDLTWHEQANLLPYKKKFEFPMKKLRLGKQLGAGVFGVVVEGMATGITSHEKDTKVAVKMLKESASSEEIKALVIELKIMANLGQHLNIVNLLGAVTKNLAQRELLIIVEHCSFGNVQNFLIKHRHVFIDQINPENDKIEPFHLKEEQRSSNESGFDDVSLYHRYQNQNTIKEMHTETSFITATSDPPCITEDIKVTLKTTDLVCWSFQVARGMEYLSSRKVIHGDLAARNVLLCDGNVIKICDFGLARSLYDSYIYVKDGAALLPFKWLAIESACDRVFSRFSDVWSFGILMWELFSLGATPYPGSDANLDLLNKLIDGYRMEKAKYATQEIYDIMLHCWNFNPESRPSFNELENRLRKLLETEVAEHYIDLNEQYVEMNAKIFGEGYLAQIGSPEKCAPSIPSLLEPTGAPGYLPMAPLKSSDDQCGN